MYKHILIPTDGSPLSAKAIELDPQNALALATYGFVKSFLYRDYDTALGYFDRALSACPNHALAWFLSSPTLSYVGRSEQAMKNAQEALRLSPLALQRPIPQAANLMPAGWHHAHLYSSPHRRRTILEPSCGPTDRYERRP